MRGLVAPTQRNTSVSASLYESVKVFLSFKIDLDFGLDVAEGCHIAIRQMPFGSCCQEV